MPDTVTLTVNGELTELHSDPETSLLTVLRNDLGLLGSRFGCGMALCGACFVRVDGAVVPACDTPLWSVAGKNVVTVEGLARNGVLHPVQQALLDHQAAQCGFCISGIVMSAAALLEDNRRPDRTAVAEALDRNLCRCGSQSRIINAVVEAGEADEPDRAAH